jgi:RNA polymerase sigma-70 factor (ECF subfamily)
LNARREQTVAQTPASLLNRLRAVPGDPAAWRYFDDLYRPLLTAWLQRHSLQPHDVEDLLQDVLATAVRELPHFQYDRNKGRFRDWLRAILVNRLRAFWRECQARPRVPGGHAFQVQVLDQLEDSNGQLSRLWAQEHDQYVVRRFLELVRGDFAPKTWQAFERLLAGEKAAGVAADLGLSVNAVYLAKASILKRLREEMSGLLD